MLRLFVLHLFFLGVYVPANSQLSSDSFDLATKKAISQLIELVALPNDALFPEDIAKNTAWLEKAFSSRGFSTELLETSNLPLFFAQTQIDPKLPTVLFYMHLDGQGVDPSKWNQSDPYQVVLKKKNEAQEFEPISMDLLQGSLDADWRLFGRSAADDKGPIVAFLQTLDLLNDYGLSPKVNIKVILDPEEEKGSKPLPAAVKKHRTILESDLLIINDGPIHLSNKPTIIYGCRGNMSVGLTVYGSIKPQHSGHYGNYVPNPVFTMSRLLTSMKDEEGKVLIPGYYDGISISQELKNLFAQVPDKEEKILEMMQIAEPEEVGSNYQESLQYPSLNVRGIAAAWVGDQARTIIPAKTVADLDFRLVPESDPTRLIQLFKEHIVSQGFYLTDQDPTKEERMKHRKIAKVTAGQPTLPFRTPINSKDGLWLSNALSNHYGESPIQIRIMGGTVPVSAFIEELDIPTFIVPMVNADNNQHAPNENMRIGNITNAIRTFYAILTADK